jgi:predicted MFS family arabinose efflux permease
MSGRVVFGLGLGVMWVTGTAWLHEAAGDYAPRALALTTSIVGAANLIGPGIIGWLADRFSFGTPFVLLSCLTGLVLVVLVLAPSPEGRTVGSDPPLREMLRAARGDHLMVTSLVITVAAAMMWMSAELLISLQLDVHGFDASEIGLAFSASSGVFLTASAVTSARAERYVTIRFTAVWTAVFAATVLTAAFGTGSRRRSSSSRR